MNLSPKAFLQTLYQRAVDRAQPEHFIADALPDVPRGKTIVLGAGKASAAMALAFDQAWPKTAPLSGLVLTRYHHTPEQQRQRQVSGQARIEVVEASHPVPDEAGWRATESMLAMTQGLSADDLVVFLISGGGSALLTKPAAGLTLADKQRLNQSLLASGASISEMNCVRKHLSAVKGGRLGAACAPARVHTLLISDVPNDDPQIIASGPTLPDPTTCAEALEIIEHYQIALPQAAWEGLRSAMFESPKPGDPRFSGHTTQICATPQLALEAAALEARRLGVQAHILSDAIEGESRVVGQVHAAIARAIAQRGEPFSPPCVLLSGGETTVTVRNPQGRGGRAVEFVLGCALALEGQGAISVLAADTDGIDGVAGHAGGFADATTLQRAQALGLSARAMLQANDAFPFFEALGDAIITGPTYTNVNDFRALLIQAPH